MKFTLSTEEQYEQCRLHNYGAPELTLVKGLGEKVWDDQGNEYLDFCTGIATTSIGHCHPRHVKAITEQAKQLIHCSNLYKIVPQGNLAEALVSKIGPGKIFFCNSGAESSETLIKLSRLFGLSKCGNEGDTTEVIVVGNAFHGRTFAGMSATPQEKIQKGFKPMLPGIEVATMNDIESVLSKITDKTAAIMLEPIQGEGGVHLASSGFLQQLRKLCDDNNILLLLDEVQCGIGRTGTFFAFEEAGIKPDAIGMAKGLGGGFPIGAVWITEKHSNLFQPGSHGSTFGGNPLASVAALAVIETIEEENLLERVQTLSKPWIESLKTICQGSKILKEVRGRGFLVGLDFDIDPAPISKALQDEGLLLTVRAGGNVIRLIPPLTVSEESLHKSIEIIKSTISKFES